MHHYEELLRKKHGLKAFRCGPVTYQKYMWKISGRRPLVIERSTPGACTLPCALCSKALLRAGLPVRCNNLAGESVLVPADRRAHEILHCTPTKWQRRVLWAS